MPKDARYQENFQNNTHLYVKQNDVCILHNKLSFHSSQRNLGEPVYFKTQCEIILVPTAEQPHTVCVACILQEWGKVHSLLFYTFIV
jgi:hypothetical protein